MSKTKLSNEICHQLVNIAKENSSQLGNIFTDSAKTGENTTIHGRYYGDAHFSKDTNCIKNMALADIDQLYHSCLQDRDCRFYFSWQ